MKLEDGTEITPSDPRDLNAPILRTLEGVDYVIACIAEQCGGEARTELDRLAGQVESDPRFAFEGSDAVAARLREAKEAMVRIRNDGYGDTVCRLARVSSELWKVILASL